MRTNVLVSVLCALAGISAFSLAGTISGRVVDERGVGVAGVDLDFFVVGTGKEEKPGNDITDAAGNYSTTVKPEIYNVTYRAPAGVRLAGHLQPSVNLNTNQSVNVTLKDAVFVSGRVVRQDTGEVLPGTDLDFTDLASGQKIFTPYDNTGADGRYTVPVPKGVYEVAFNGPEPVLPTDPPQMASLALKEVSVAPGRDVALPQVSLPRGYHVTGELQNDKGDLLASVDLDFYEDATGRKTFTKADNTDARGRYDVIVPVGTYTLEFDPPAGAFEAAKVRTNVVVTAAGAALGIDVLPEAPALSGLVKDPDGNVLRRVRLDFTRTSTGAAVHTANNWTDATGRYAVRILGGTYNVRYTSEVNSLVDADTSSSITISADRTMPDKILLFHDEDTDTRGDIRDKCPFAADAAQSDTDADGIGDACDNCPSVANVRQEDNDGDRIGNACDPDDDGDGVADGIDGDRDGDGVTNAGDRCPDLRDPRQYDRDTDGTGDACDADDGDVEGLVARSRRGFTWRAETGAVEYHAFRQTLAWLSSVNYGPVFRDELRGRVLLDLEAPVSGGAFAYVVTAQMQSGEGPLGRRGDGTLRTNLRDVVP